MAEHDTLAKLAAHESENTVWLLAVGDDGIGSELVTGWTALRRAWLDNHRSFVDHDNLTEEDRETLSLLDDDDEWKHDDRGERFSLHVSYEGDWITVTRVDGAVLTAQAPVAVELDRILIALGCEGQDQDTDPVAMIDMLRSWEADAQRRVEKLARHLSNVLEIARTWQPDYATKMDRDTLAFAAAEAGKQ